MFRKSTGAFASTKPKEDTPKEKELGKYGLRETDKRISRLKKMKEGKKNLFYRLTLLGFSLQN